MHGACVEMGTSPRPIRVFLADDHAIVRQGLRQLLETAGDFLVVGEAVDGRAVLNAPDKDSWDVLVLDLSLPRVSGVEVMRRLHESQPGLRVVVLSMYPEDQYGLRMLKEGAAAYLGKTEPPETIIDTIRRVAAGEVVRTEAVHRAEEAARSRSERAPHETLSAREYQVFMLIAQGRTVADIAAELNLSGSTVSNHLAHVREKLRAQSNGEIVRYAYRAGLIDEP
ncbi:MAG: response regulator transcription factor [Myxococcales bacterium]|nr:response regulator transcription factor [Myxococcales bacterium]